MKKGVRKKGVRNLFINNFLWYDLKMGRVLRTDVGNYIYHVLNRANARVQIFENDKDYQLFEQILTESKEKCDIRLLDRKSTRLNSSHTDISRMPSSA